MTYNLYWGDLHSHCSISYGHGSVEQALLRAKQQLDFCSITGHAFWPDMPTDRETYADIIDYHNIGFARLARNWQSLLDQQTQISDEGTFLALPSYEWHSGKYGDHNIYAAGPELPLQGAPDLPQLRNILAEQNAIAIPHHIGYKAGYRGINWKHYREDISPFVEIFSLHGCSLAQDAPYPMLHDMGPRDGGSLAEAGWKMGHKFGIVGGTDHHAAYPGSHGDGRMGVFATSLTRDALWEAFLNRRVYAATGDNIDARLFINDAWIGSEISAPGTRHIQVAVRGMDKLDKVELLRNGRVIHRFFPQPAETQPSRRYRLRLTWGWGRKDKLIDWNAKLTLSDGSITAVDTCFSGQPVVAPKEQVGDEEIPDDQDLPHALLERTDRTVTWRSITKGNPTMRHQTTQGLSLEIESALNSKLTVEVNGNRYEHTLAELIPAARSHYLQSWLSEAIQIGPAVPLEECQVEDEISDEPENETDYYRLQASQHNGQWAWLSPIWVGR